MPGLYGSPFWREGPREELCNVRTVVNPLLNWKQLTCLQTEGLCYLFSKATAKSLENKERFIYSLWIIWGLALGFIFVYVSVLVINTWREKGGRGVRKSANCEVKALCSKYQILWDLQRKPKCLFHYILQLRGVILDSYYWFERFFYYFGLLAYFCVIYSDKPGDLTLCERVLWSVLFFPPLVLIIRCCTVLLR